MQEAHAKNNRLGLWSGCFTAPQQFRRWNKKEAALLGFACGNHDAETREFLFPDDPAMPVGCPIKGKISLRANVTGHRGIYHLEGCRSYAKTTNPNRWFCSEEEALQAGFRKAYTCPANAATR